MSTFRQASLKLPCIEIRSDGSTSFFNYSSNDFLQSGIHARDLFSLDIGLNNDILHDKKTRISSPVILPRDDAVVISLGNIKAILFSDRLLLLEPNQVLVKQWCINFVKNLHRKKRINMDPRRDSFRNEFESGSFELFVIEDILKSTCDMFERRMHLFSPLVDNLLQVSMYSTRIFQKFRSK